MQYRYSIRRLCALWCIGLLLSLGSISAQSRTYTLDADFDEGSILNLNHSDVPNQLQLNQTASGFPFVNIAASQRGTMIRINTETGAIVGEYWTAPANMAKDPSRTTVDLFGNTWVTNRAESGFDGMGGSLVRVGLVVGGTRVNASGTPDANGDYLMPPFIYNTCIDKDSDGKIKTSRGLGHILDWPNASNVDNNGGVDTATDECHLNYTRVQGTNARTLAIDKNNDIWVGGYGNQAFEKLSGLTGLPVPGTQFNLGCGGYGGFIDKNGILWGASSGLLRLLRYDTNTNTGVCLAPPPNRGDYGLGLNPLDGHIWHSSLSTYESGFQQYVYELDSNGNPLSMHLQPFGGAQGVAVDGNGHVWVAQLFGSQVAHYAPDPLNPGDYLYVGVVTGLLGTTGLAVDAAGKIWASENSDRVSRIDPALGAIGGGSYPIGGIDLSVPLGSGAGPYNYSDMTGFVSLGSTAPQGTWTVVHDGGAPGIAWQSIAWNGNVPNETQIAVRMRVSDDPSALSGLPFVDVTNGGALSGVMGRYIEVQATLSRGPNTTESPTLTDLTISAEQGGVDVTAAECGPIRFEKNNMGKITAVMSSISDPESGIASIMFQKLINMNGWVDTDGPYMQGQTHMFSPAAPMALVKGVRILMGKAASLEVLVTNGAGLTSVCDPVFETTGSDLPLAFGMDQNFPNPFSSTTIIRYNLPEPTDLSISVYDVLGRKVVTLVQDEARAAGRYELTWDGTDAAGNKLPNGTYLYRIDAGGTIETHRLAIVR